LTEGFLKATRLDDVTPARPLRVTVDNREIVIFKNLDEIFAVENLCPHQQYSIFHQSVPNGTTLTCPMHGWSFDLRTGKAIAGSGRVKVFEVKIENGEIFIRIPAPSKSIFD
jgi:nitrite reductase/ring-hydroxylating ferredoxin subunit